MYIVLKAVEEYALTGFGSVFCPSWETAIVAKLATQVLCRPRDRLRQLADLPIDSC